MFTAIIVKPIFNLLVLIYALLPGHNFGLSIILFTIVVRLLMWPLVKKQLHHARIMREMQPELKRIKQAAAGNRQQESLMVMQLYKEKGVNPFSSIGILIVQLPILIALYSGIRRIIFDHHSLVNFAYPFIRNLAWMKHLGANINVFDGSLFHVVDLTRAAIDKSGTLYIPALIIVTASAAAQYIQSKQLLPDQGKARKLRDILREANRGKRADQAEVNAAVGRSTQFFIPGLIFLVTVNIASALSLYFLTSGVVAAIQQRKILKQDETELTALADKPDRTIIEGEVIDRKANNKTKKPQRKRKRRR